VSSRAPPAGVVPVASRMSPRSVGLRGPIATQSVRRALAGAPGWREGAATSSVPVPLPAGGPPAAKLPLHHEDVLTGVPVVSRAVPTTAGVSARSSVDIEVEEVDYDLTDDDLVELRDEPAAVGSTGGNIVAGERPWLPADSGAPVVSVSDYEGGEDPIDGTTSLPAEYDQHGAPYYYEGGPGDKLPAFPLEESLPPAPSSRAPTSIATPLSAPLPQFSLDDTSDLSSEQPTPYVGRSHSAQYGAPTAYRSSEPPIISVSTPSPAQQPVSALATTTHLAGPPSYPTPPASSAVQSEVSSASSSRRAAVTEPADAESGPVMSAADETEDPDSLWPLQAPTIRGIALSEVRGLADLPEDTQRLLRQRARIERMGAGEDLSFFAVVLVLEGWVKLMPAISDVACATANVGEVVFTQGTLAEGVALRVVAGQNGTTLATWDRDTFAQITDSCPWVAEELHMIADGFQALAGTALGPLGERLDDTLRKIVTSRCEMRLLLPNEVIVSCGKTVPGMYIVGGGLVELVDSRGGLVSTCASGEFLLTEQVLAGGVSPFTARAASCGALVLFAPRLVAHELLVSVPPLLEILAG
jgi:hypothetical protein